MVPEGCPRRGTGATAPSADIGSLSGRRRCRLDGGHVVVQSGVGGWTAQMGNVACCRVGVGVGGLSFVTLFKEVIMLIKCS